MWETIKYIGSPVTLIAFAIAVLAHVYKKRLIEERKNLEAIPEKDRATIVKLKLETYHLKDDTLTNEQKFELVKKVINRKMVGFRIATFALVILALIFLFSTVFIFKYSPILNSWDNQHLKEWEQVRNIGGVLNIMTVEFFEFIIEMQNAQDAQVVAYEHNNKFYGEFRKELNSVKTRLKTFNDSEFVARTGIDVKLKAELIEKLVNDFELFHKNAGFSGLKPEAIREYLKKSSHLKQIEKVTRGRPRLHSQS